MTAIANGLPDIYAKLFPAMTQLKGPEESLATCNNCPMIKVDTTIAKNNSQEPRFNPQTKCCTYHPRMPNFLVGALLSDTDPRFDEGRRRIREKIDKRVGITPWWFQAPALHEHLYKQVKSAFGRAESLACPLYSKDIGGCTVWKFREVVCSTWFCKYQAGEDGRKYWTALKQYMTLVEKQLSRFAMLEIDPNYVIDDQSFAHYANESLTTEDIEGLPPSDATYQHLWRNYAGKEEEFYIKCHESVSRLKPEDMPQILGLDGKVRWLDLEAKLAAINCSDLPMQPELNPDATIKWLDAETIALGSYSEYDAVALPSAAYQLLKDMRGTESLGTIRNNWQRDYGTDLSDEILMTLHRHRIII